jgi:hypothetical protein
LRVLAHNNVNGAYGHAGQILRLAGLPEETRNGPALVFPTPVTTVYKRPCERVLLWRPRMANPFFHLFESMWMLAGRDDAAWLDQYVSDFGARYAEPDGTLHGAYGHRWRHHFGRDQIRDAITLLRRDPTTRRCVITMWNPREDLGASKSDIPCNTHIYLSIRHGRLDMLVSCRSNDAVWGAYGANSVHMSVLQEFVAWAVGVDVGELRQVSYNLHVYQSTLHLLPERPIPDPYIYHAESGVAILTRSPLFSGDPDHMLGAIEEWTWGPSDPPWRAPLFRELLVPMHDAWVAYRADKEVPIERRRAEASSIVASRVSHVDWREACLMWLNRNEGMSS